MHRLEKIAAGFAVILTAIGLLVALVWVVTDARPAPQNAEVQAQAQYPRDEGYEVWLPSKPPEKPRQPRVAAVEKRAAPNPYSVAALRSTPHRPVVLTQPPEAKNPAKREAALVDWAKKQGATQSIAERTVKAAVRFGHIADPYLILAITKVESSFRPEAKSFANAQGLMQVIHAKHPEKVKGTNQKLIDDQILVGAKVLREYSTWYQGDLSKVFITYSGNASRYQEKVMKARAEIIQVISRT